MRAWKNRVTGTIAVIFVVGMVLMGMNQGAWAAAGDIVADRILGQPNCTSSAPNTVDPEAMNQPNAVAIDKGASPYHVYVADSSNNRVLGYSSIAALINGGSAAIAIGQPNLSSSSAGFGASATNLNSPKAVAVDKSGNLYVADTGNNRVLEYNTPFKTSAATGMTGGFAANMVFGQALDFTSNQCDFGFSGLPTAETMCAPTGVALDSNGNLFVADTDNNRVLAFKTPFNAATDANVVLGQNGSFNTALNNLGSGPAGPPSAASLSGPTGLAVDASNSLYVADTGNSRVLKFSTPLTNTTANLVFGQGAAFNVNGCNQSSFSPGSGTLCHPTGVAVDTATARNVFIADTDNNRVLMFKSPIAASPMADFVFGQTGFSANQCSGGGMPPSNATLCGPRGVAADISNLNLLIADTNNNRVLHWPYTTTGPAAGAKVVLGQPDFTHNAANTVDATGLSGPAAVAIDKSDTTTNHLWVVDTNNNRVLGYTSAATFTTYSAANIVIGQPDFYSGSSNQGSFGPTAKTLSAPNAAAVDAVGNLYVADGGNNRVLMYTKPFISGIKANQAASVVFGQGGNFTTNSGVCPPSLNPCPPLPPPAGTATQGGMCQPSGVAVDTRSSNGALYISDKNNSRVLVFKAPFSANPLPTLVLGQPTFTANYPNRQNGCGFIFPAANTLSGPGQIATDALGNLYVADIGNNRTLEYKTPSVSGASANRVFGQLGNFTGSDCNLDAEERSIGPSTLCDAEGVAADTSLTPNIYIADTGNNRILWYSTPLTSGNPAEPAELVIGQPDFFPSQCNFGGSAPSCKSLCGALTPAVDRVGNLYVPDTGNNRVLEYDKPDPPVATPTHTPTAKPTPTRTPTPKATPTRTPTPKPPTLAPKAASNAIKVGLGSAVLR